MSFVIQVLEYDILNRVINTLSSFQCIGPSMKPTLNRFSNGDVVITEHISARNGNLKRSHSLYFDFDDILFILYVIVDDWC